MRKKLEQLRGVGQGRRLIIIASGPSVSRVNFDGLTDAFDVLYVNRPYKPLLDYARYWAVNDQPIVRQHMRGLRYFPGQVICGASAFIPGRDYIKVKVIPGPGISLDLVQGFHLGRSTTLSSLQAALWMGYERIFIVGMDMCLENGEAYFDRSDNPAVSLSTREVRFKTEAHNWAVATEALIKHGLIGKVRMVTDCNPWPFIKAYEVEDTVDPRWTDGI